MRFLKFAGFYLAFALLIFIIVIGLNWNEFTTVFDNEEALTEGKEFVQQTFSLGGLADFASEHPDLVSTYSSALYSDEINMAFQEKTERTLGILGTVFIQAHLMKLASENTLDLNQKVDIDSVSAYQLPHVYASSHLSSLELLKENNSISNGKVSYKDLLKVLIEYNSLAIYDFLLMHFGESEIMESAKAYGFNDDLVLLPFSGLSIQFHPQFTKASFEEVYSRYQALPKSEWYDKVFLSTHAWIHNPQFRSDITDYFEEYQQGIGFLEEKKSFELYPQIKAESLVSFVKAVIKSPLLTEEYRQQFYDLLDWPMTDRSIAYWFTYYGGVFENRMSIASGIDIAVSKERSDTLVQAVFFDQIPIALWFHMTSKFIHLDYQRRIAWDEDLRNRTLSQKSSLSSTQ